MVPKCKKTISFLACSITSSFRRRARRRIFKSGAGSAIRRRGDAMTDHPAPDLTTRRRIHEFDDPAPGGAGTLQPLVPRRRILQFRRRNGSNTVTASQIANPAPGIADPATETALAAPPNQNAGAGERKSGAGNTIGTGLRRTGTGSPVQT